MVRLLNIVSVLALLGCAVYAYQIKYETVFYAEQLVKMKHGISRERDSIGVLRAEWAHLTRPERVQALAQKHLDLAPISLAQIVRANELPAKAPKFDAIGRKLESLGIFEPTNTPGDFPTGSTATPGAKAPAARKANR